jgi:predicted nucleic acid-binding protein
VLAYLSGNRRYIRYFEKDTGHLTVLNLMEIYYGVLKDYGEADAEQAYSANAKYAVEFGDDDVKDAMKRRLALRGKKLNLSYADALGYSVSLRLRVKFLTGDEAFEELENVEYVK